MGKIYVCSDIHGDWVKYDNAIKTLKEDDTLYILGDATDRGDYGIKILQDIMRRRESTQGPKVEYVLGNHDYDLLMYEKKMSDRKLFNQNNIIQLLNIVPQYVIGNGGKKTAMDLMSMSGEERKKLRDFLENSYIQVVIGDPNIMVDNNKRQNIDCPRRFVLTHSVAPIRRPKSFTFQEAVSFIKETQKPKETLAQINDEEIKKYYDSFSGINNAWRLYFCAASRMGDGIAGVNPEDEYQFWKEKGYLTIVGHTPDKYGHIQYSEEHSLLGIDTSENNNMPVLCLNDGAYTFVKGKDSTGIGQEAHFIHPLLERRKIGTNWEKCKQLWL